MEEPKYYRARVKALKEALANTDDPQERVYLYRGYKSDLVIPEPINEENSPLTQLEVMTWDTWFTMHPEKVCGTVHTVNHFIDPIYIKGTREDVENKILQPITSDLILLAMAELELLNLNF